MFSTADLLADRQGRASAAAAPTRAPAFPPALARAGASGLGRLDANARARLLRSLQRTHGNAAVKRLAAGSAGVRRCACGGVIGADGQCERCRRQTALGRRVLAREVTYKNCSKERERAIASAHARAERMLEIAADKLSRYDGTDPPEVKRALQRNFTTSDWPIALGVRAGIAGLRAAMAILRDPQYECRYDDSRIAGAEWLCLPVGHILLHPQAFGEGGNKTAMYLLHEWFHKYLCALDFAYQEDKEYSEMSPILHLLNADSLAGFVYDVCIGSVPPSPGAAGPTPRRPVRPAPRPRPTSGEEAWGSEEPYWSERERRRRRRRPWR
jgi:hypothetical protein